MGDKFSRENIKSMWSSFIDNNVIDIKVSEDIEDLLNPEDYKGQVLLFIKDYEHYNTVMKPKLYKVRDIILHYNDFDCSYNFDLLVVRPEVAHKYGSNTKSVFMNGVWLIG